MELLAALGVYTTLRVMLAGRRVLHLIDNTTALSAVVHGYASKPSLAPLANMYHMQLAAICSDVWHLLPEGKLISP